MNERPAPPDPHPGLIDRLGELLFPWLYPDPPAAEPSCFPCIDHDHMPAKPEPELEAEP